MSIDTGPTLTPEEQEHLTGLLDEALKNSLVPLQLDRQINTFLEAKDGKSRAKALAQLLTAADMRGWEEGLGLGLRIAVILHNAGYGKHLPTILPGMLDAMTAMRRQVN